MRSTGWFGRPNKKGGKVHVVENGRPICGTNIPDDAVYQFCAEGVHRKYLECERCRSLVTKVVRPAKSKPTEIRLIIRPKRRIKIRTMGNSVLYHIRAIVDDEIAVMRTYNYSARQWDYFNFTMTDLQEWYTVGRLS